MIYTSYFAGYKGLDGVAVGHKPKWFKGEEIEELIPSWALVNIWKTSPQSDYDKEYYEKRYRKEVLSKLDAGEMYKKLDGKVLLCYETSNDFCHRHIICKWFNENGFQCEELKIEKKVKEKPVKKEKPKIEQLSLF